MVYSCRQRHTGVWGSSSLSRRLPQVVVVHPCAPNSLSIDGYAGILFGRVRCVDKGRLTTTGICEPHSMGHRS
jgi:hypothetical protein